MSFHDPLAQSAAVRIARLASRQHGVVTRRQALAAGVTSAQLQHRLESGGLIRARNGVYRVAGAPRTWEQRAAEACLGVPGAVLWGRSAAVVWRLDLPAPKVVDVAVTHRAGTRVGASRGGVRVRRVRTLDESDRTCVGSHAVTTLARTLVDLASVLDAGALRRVLDDACARRLVSPHRIEETLQRVGGRGRPGVGAVRHALAPWLAGCGFDSVAELDCLRLLAAAGLPAPACQHPVMGPQGVPRVIDFAWPEQSVALEVDGYRWHGSPDAHARDSLRVNELAASGWTVLRTTPTELLEHPGSVLEALRRRLCVPC